MTDLISRLRDTPNWMRESYGSWKDCVLKYDRAPFEAADEIERLRAALTRVTTTYDAYRRRGVVPSPVEYADVIVAIEQARAALKEPT